MEVDDLPEGYLQGFAFAKEALVYGCNFNPSCIALSQRLERFVFLLLFKIYLHLLVLNTHLVVVHLLLPSFCVCVKSD